MHESDQIQSECGLSVKMEIVLDCFVHVHVPQKVIFFRKFYLCGDLGILIDSCKVRSRDHQLCRDDSGWRLGDETVLPPEGSLRGQLIPRNPTKILLSRPVEVF